MAAGVLGSDPTQVLHRAISRLSDRAGSRGLLLGVDDAHLLDELSATLLHQVVLRHAAAVVVTLRTGEPAPDAVTALWKDAHLPRLEVQPLSAEETAVLLEAALGGPVESSAARRLHAITEGNTLYLRQLVDEELETGRLREVLGFWRWVGHPRLSAGLTELVLQRIGALSVGERDVVDVVAFGEPLDMPMLIAMTDSNPVEAAEARGLITLSMHGGQRQARLAHPLYGEVRRHSCGALRARRLRGRIANALAHPASGRNDDDTVRRAVLMLDSDLEPDAELFVSAAQRVLDLTDCVLAEKLARAAVAAGGGFEPRLTLSTALSWMPRGVEADEELKILAALASTDAERSRAAIPRVANLFWTLADPAVAESALAAARHSVRGHAATLELDAIGSVLEGFLGRTTVAYPTAAAVAADPESSEDALILATWGLTTAGGGLGRVRGLVDLVTRVQRIAGSPNLGLVRVGAIGDAWLRALRLAGELNEAEEFARYAVGIHGDDPGPVRLMVIAGQGRVATDRGQVRTAARLLREAAEPRIPPAWSYYLPLSQVAPLAMAGDLAAARANLAEAEAERHPAMVCFEPDLLLARAWVAATEGALSHAVEYAHRAAGKAASMAQAAVEVVALHTAVCFGDRTVAGRLAELATRVDGPRAPAAAAHAVAFTANDGDALMAASRQLEDFGAMLLAMDAAAHASLAHTRLGRSGSGRAALARAHRLAQLCENPSTPALVAASQPLPLTEREREIATLAAHGLTNREIADRLVVSLRTVEGHLYRASSKLGTTNRAEFAALLTGW